MHNNVTTFLEKLTNRRRNILVFIVIVNFKRIHWKQRESRERDGERLVSYALTIFLRFLLFPDSPEMSRAAQRGVVISRATRPLNSRESNKKYLQKTRTSSTRARRSAVVLRDFLKITE